MFKFKIWKIEIQLIPPKITIVYNLFYGLGKIFWPPTHADKTQTIIFLPGPPATATA